MGRFNKSASINFFYMLLDCLFSLLAFVVAALLYQDITVLFSGMHLGACTVFTIIYILSNKTQRIYTTTLFFYADRIFRYISKSFVIAVGLVATMLFIVGESNISRSFFIIFAVTHYVMMLFSALVTRTAMKREKKYSQRALLVGTEEQYQRFNTFLYKSNMDVEIVGYVSETQEREPNMLGVFSELQDIIRDKAVDEVFFWQHRDQTFQHQDVIEMCLRMGVIARVILHPYKFGAAQNYICSVGTYPVMTYHNVDLNAYSRAIKRIVDIIGSLCGIILSSPIMLIAAIAIKLDSKGPVIFAQTRVGKNGRRFKIYKFRSMCQDAEKRKEELLDNNVLESNLMFKMEHDPRVTRVGRIIRKCSIDEFPQFFNVLKGDMSLVGTRPPTLDEVEQYTTEHWRRISIKPGITGMWQVSGRSKITDFEEVVELDTEYIDQWSLALDIKIMLKTVLQIVARRSEAY